MAWSSTEIAGGDLEVVSIVSWLDRNQKQFRGRCAASVPWILAPL